MAAVDAGAGKVVNLLRRVRILYCLLNWHGDMSKKQSAPP